MNFENGCCKPILTYVFAKIEESDWEYFHSKHLKIKWQIQVVIKKECKTTKQDIQKLYYLRKQELVILSKEPKLFVSQTDTIVVQAINSLII